MHPREPTGIEALLEAGERHVKNVPDAIHVDDGIIAIGLET
jgi:N-acetylglucosamine-6-phosphate deacetylase